MFLRMCVRSMDLLAYKLHKPSCCALPTTHCSSCASRTHAFTVLCSFSVVNRFQPFHTHDIHCDALSRVTHTARADDTRREQRTIRAYTKGHSLTHSLTHTHANDRRTSDNTSTCSGARERANDGQWHAQIHTHTHAHAHAHNTLARTEIDSSSAWNAPSRLSGRRKRTKPRASPECTGQQSRWQRHRFVINGEAAHTQIHAARAVYLRRRSLTCSTSHFMPSSTPSPVLAEHMNSSKRRPEPAHAMAAALSSLRIYCAQ